MGKNKPLSILKRAPGQPKKKRPAAQEPTQSSAQKKHKLGPSLDEHVSTPSGAARFPSKARKPLTGPERRLPKPQKGPVCAWEAVSVVDRQAAWALQQLLRADVSGNGGASIKSLTLHPSIEAKKATYAVTCQTLKLLPVLQQLLKASDLLQRHPELQPETAYVLVYEVLFGEGLRRRGPPEKAVMAAKGELQKILEDMKAEAGRHAAAGHPLDSPRILCAAEASCNFSKP